MQNTEHRILIIDDDPQIPVMLRMMLTQAGYAQVDTTALGLPGLEKIKAGEADVVFLDLDLPDIEGPSLLRSIVEHDNSIPIIVISGFSAQYKVDQALQAGATAYLKKPFRKAEALEALEQACVHIGTDGAGPPGRKD